MSKTPKSAKFDEKTLTKMQIRKLNALRKSLGSEIAERAFSEWLEQNPSGQSTNGNDPVAASIAEAVMGLLEKKKMRLPRGGYTIRRGRGRVLVERPAE